MKEITKQFKYNLILEQKAFYFDEGAKIYSKLNSMGGLGKGGDFDNETVNSILKYSKNKKFISFVSLGIGDSEREEKLIEIFKKKNVKMDLYGVDSSYEMINLSLERLKKIDCFSRLIYADFFEDSFFEEIDYQINEKSQKIIGFLGGTLGNVPHNYMANKLSNMSKKGDILVIEVSGKKKIDELVLNKYFKRYIGYLEKFDEVNFLKLPLEKLGVDTNSGEIALVMEKERTTNGAVFSYRFNVKEKISFNLKEEEIVLLKGDIIKLIDIRVYEVDKLVEFFEERKFECLEYRFVEGRMIQIFFKKL